MATFGLLLGQKLYCRIPIRCADRIPKSCRRQLFPRLTSNSAFSSFAHLQALSLNHTSKGIFHHASTVEVPTPLIDSTLPPHEQNMENPQLSNKDRRCTMVCARGPFEKVPLRLRFVLQAGGICHTKLNQRTSKLYSAWTCSRPTPWGRACSARYGLCSEI